MTHSSDLSQTAADHARDLGQKAKDAVRHTAQAQAQHAQDEAAAHVQTTSDAARAYAAEVPDDSVQAQAAQHIAGQLEQVAGHLRTADLSQTVGQVSDFARRNPALFIGAAALAGFAAARFLKSSAPAPSQPLSADDPWATHGGGSDGTA
ncbi:hypothetical protein [Nereida sp. MMG025]|uniref:hypothetical protein n=1 Tax=Nereida sp. MMG025 TaxID=2909981 RepID=UPI001F33FE3C|nr:hypothetical protein [Nereida sp. MMG025]MCF6445871.1 hypothetical protein [Nereida sp. MMG025]